MFCLFSLEFIKTSLSLIYTGVGRVSAVSVTGGTCPSGCSGDCYPECNPVCCGAAVSLSAPAIPSGFTACPQFPGCGTPCQSSCSQSCCQQNPYQTVSFEILIFLVFISRL